MKKGWKLWGNTITWLKFENQISFEDAILKIKGYSIKWYINVYYYNNKVAEIYKKNWLYKYLLGPSWINYKELISKKLLPDNAIYVISNKILFIIEIKYQQVEWSVDEKLQTCDFKLKQYKRLLKPLKFKVEYCYVLNKWFMKEKYQDVLNYIQATWCKYFFWEIPLDYLWLPNSI